MLMCLKLSSIRVPFFNKNKQIDATFLYINKYINSVIKYKIYKISRNLFCQVCSLF